MSELEGGKGNVSDRDEPVGEPMKSFTFEEEEVELKRFQIRKKIVTLKRKDTRATKGMMEIIMKAKNKALWARISRARSTAKSK